MQRSVGCRPALEISVDIDDLFFLLRPQQLRFLLRQPRLPLFRALIDREAPAHMLPAQQQIGQVPASLAVAALRAGAAVVMGKVEMK